MSQFSRMTSTESVTCPNTKYGCEFVGIEAEITDHLLECVFEKFKKYIEHNEKRIEHIEAKLSEREKEVAVLRKTVAELSKVVESTAGISPRPKTDRKPGICCTFGKLMFQPFLLQSKLPPLHLLHEIRSVLLLIAMYQQHLIAHSKQQHALCSC